jgi:NAD(P)H-hydrate repair Nnr-like enzyme with NAD(P)H-hydrate dehydratase domain
MKPLACVWIAACTGTAGRVLVVLGVADADGSGELDGSGATPVGVSTVTVTVGSGSAGGAEDWQPDRIIRPHMTAMPPIREKMTPRRRAGDQ